MNPPPSSPSGPDDVPGPGPRSPWATFAPFAGLMCLLLAAAVHAPSVRNGWGLDDVPVVRENPALAKGAGGLSGVFRTPSWPGELEEQPWRPLTLAWLSVELPLWGGANGRAAAAGVHAVNVVLHVAVTLLLLALLSRVFPGRMRLAVGTALVFAVHPLATGVVSSATGRADLLAALFGLLALLAWWAYVPGRPATLPLAALCFFLALLSKETALALPFVALALDATRSAGAVDALRRRWPGYAALGGVLVLWLFLWPGPGRPAMDLPASGAGERLLLGLQALGRHVVDVLCPVALLPDRSVEAVTGSGYPFHAAATVTTFLSGLALLLAALLPARGAGPRVLRGAVFAGGALALGAALVLPVGGVLEDRAAYLLLPALALMGGLALEAVTGATGAPRWLGAVGAGLAVLALGILSVAESAVWRDDSAIHERLLAREPGHGPAMLRLARRLTAESREGRAAASRLRADDTRVPEILADAAEARRRALDLAERAARLSALTDDPEVPLLLGLLYIEDGRPAQAEPFLKEARRLEPLLHPRPGEPAPEPRPRALARAVAIYDGLGRSYLAQASMERAADALDEAVRWERRAAAAAGRAPDAQLLYRAGMTLLGDGRFVDALPILSEVASSAPDPELRQQAAGQHAEGTRTAVKRLQAVMAQGNELDKTPGKEKTALDTYLEALRVDQHSVLARERAAILLKFFGRYPEAKNLVADGLKLLDSTAPGPETDRERARLTSLLTDIERWERENAAEEEREMREHEERLKKKRNAGR